MTLPKTPIFELVRIIDLQPPGGTSFCLLIAPAADTTVVPELALEIGIQIGVRLALVDAMALAPGELFESVGSADAPIVAVLGLEAWNDTQFTAIDVNRSHLEAGKFVIFKLDAPAAARLLDRAPNLRSSIGGSIFVWAPDPANMSREEIENRLRQLSDHFRMRHEDVIERAQDGSLPAEPEFSEWLVLLGRGDLVK